MNDWHHANVIAPIGQGATLVKVTGHKEFAFYDRTGHPWWAAPFLNTYWSYADLPEGNDDGPQV